MNAEPVTLAAEIQKSLEAMEKLEGEILAFRNHALTNKSTADAMATAHFLATFYTCAETVFFRISQHFENNLSPANWHAELLNKMCLEIPGIRPRVISESSRRDLDELRRFRHFTRYYFDIDYDWRRLGFLYDVFECLRTPLRTELNAFAASVAQAGS